MNAIEKFAKEHGAEYEDEKTLASLFKEAVQSVIGEKGTVDSAWTYTGSNEYGYVDWEASIKDVDGMLPEDEIVIVLTTALDDGHSWVCGRYMDENDTIAECDAPSADDPFDAVYVINKLMSEVQEERSSKGESKKRSCSMQNKESLGTKSESKKNERGTTHIETYAGFDELLGYADAEYLLEDVVDVLSKYYTYENETFDEDQAKDDPEFTIKIEGGDERADFYSEDVFYVHLPNTEAAEELAKVLGGKIDYANNIAEKKLGKSDMKKLTSAINRGYIFEALDIAEDVAKTNLEEVKKAGEALDECEQALAAITMYKGKLDAIGATAVRKAIDYTYSEEGESAEKIMKTVKDALKELYTQFGDLASAREMVSTFRSKYATNGTMSLNNGGNAVIVTRQELEDLGLDPNVSAYDYIARTAVTNKTKNAKLAEELAPIIENAKSLTTSIVAAGEKTIDVAEFEKLLAYLEDLKKRSEETTKVIQTRFFQATPAEIGTIPKESRMQEGLLETLKNMFKGVVDAVTEGVGKALDFLFGMQDEVDEAGDAYDELMATLASMGYKVKVFKQEKQESVSSLVAKISESVGVACDNLAKDASLDGEFVDEIIYTKEAFKDIADSLNKATESLKALKGIASYHVNEGNMEIVGILADAITKIAADDSGEEEDDGSEIPDELPQEVDRTYQGGEQEEPEEEEPPFGEEPGEF